MAGLLDNIRKAQQTQSRGLLSHQQFNPVTGRQIADAAQSVGLLASPIPVVGDVMGFVGDAAMYAAKPEERTWANAALTALGALPFVPSIAGKADEASRLARMAEQGYTRGHWRGGAGVADGPHYAFDPDAAAKFAERHGDKKDVREYALRLGNAFDANDNFGPEDLKQIAVALEKFGNKAAAKELPSMAGDYRSGAMPGGALWQVLNVQTGGNAYDLLRSAGFDSVRAGQETIMLNMGNVRDANRAAFDPAHLAKFGPFLGVAGVGLLGGANDDSSR
jgi:hypothetical protein